VSAVIRLPEVLTGMSEATLISWSVQVGEQVRVGQPLADVETEKASVEYLAEVSGVLAEHLVELNQPVAVGTPIALLATAGETVEQARVSRSVPAPATGPVPVSTPAPESATGDARAPRLRATPLVRRLAARRGIDLAALEGTGPGGRIVRRDLERLTAGTEGATGQERSASIVTVPTPTPTTEPAAVPVGAEPVAVPHSGMRRAIARRLTESKASVPHFYLSADCQVDALLALRRQLNEAHGVSISINDFVLKAVAGALRDVPEMNAMWTPDAVLRHQKVDIAVAVALEDGLVTPVVRDVDTRSLSDVSAEVRDLARRARDGRLKQHELDGGTFSVSNLGMYGTERFAAIINPPHSGILAVGAATARPVVVDGQLTVGTVLSVTLSGDHRVVDGATGARWLDSFVRRMRDPLRILV
jgi:pyruvate dehydrogenase E2 component (dihydrolipoyllysine-residue acetyltransferase)